MKQCITLSVSLALLVPAPESAGAQVRAAACCTVATINASTGVATGTVTASGYVFEFTARNAAALGGLRVGQPIHANFRNNQVSLDGRTLWGTVTRAPAPPATVRQPPAPGRPAAGTAAPGAGQPVLDPIVQALLLPQPPPIGFGAPIAHTSATRQLAIQGRILPPRRYENLTLTASVAGRQVSRTVLHLYGLEGIENAPSDLPDGVRRLLEIHARKTPAGQHTHYIVDPEVTREWIKDHPVPSDVKVRSGGKCKGNEWERFRCRTEKSWDNWSELTSAEWERLRERAQGWWEDAAETLKQCGTSTDGWTDHVASGPALPVKFSQPVSMTVNMQQSGSRGHAKGALGGSVTLGLPLEADFEAGVTFFYIPCLPGVYRLRSLKANGSLTVGNQLGVAVTATGSFDKTFTIPPTGGPQIPLWVIPIVIGKIPVAVIDVSAYVEGDVQVAGEGNATGSFTVSNSHRSVFQFECDGNGCKGRDNGSSAPTTTTQTAQLDGQVSVKPGIFTALQLSFNYNILQARAGPQPYLLGIANGCGAVSATQTGGTGSTTQTNAALVADLDWGVMLRAEALAGGQRIGDRWEYNGLMRDKHMWFRDLAPGGSSALMPSVTAAGPFTAAQAAVVKVRMPSCYPYGDKVQYRLTWDGGATLAAPGNVCSWQAGSGTCTFDPARDLTLSVVWPNAGTFNLSVQLVEDTHRRFSPTPQPTRLAAPVAAAASQP